MTKVLGGSWVDMCGHILRTHIRCNGGVFCFRLLLGLILGIFILGLFDAAPGGGRGQPLGSMRCSHDRRGVFSVKIRTT